MYDILFFTLAAISIAGAISMILMTQPIFAALSFIITLIALAGIYALLGSSFLFAIQIIIYAGAIVSLILFIIMFLNIKVEHLPKEPHKKKLLIGGTLLVSPFAVLLLSILNNYTIVLGDKAQGFGSLKNVGASLYAKYVLPFEMVSLLLLAALIGAIILANKEGMSQGGNNASL